jgi:hypothetical protein
MRPKITTMVDDGFTWMLFDWTTFYDLQFLKYVVISDSPQNIFDKFESFIKIKTPSICVF